MVEAQEPSGQEKTFVEEVLAPTKINQAKVIFLTENTEFQGLTDEWWLIGACGCNKGGNSWHGWAKPKEEERKSSALGGDLAVVGAT